MAEFEVTPVKMSAFVTVDTVALDKERTSANVQLEAICERISAIQGELADLQRKKTALQASMDSMTDIQKIAEKIASAKPRKE